VGGHASKDRILFLSVGDNINQLALQQNIGAAMTMNQEVGPIAGGGGDDGTSTNATQQHDDGSVNKVLQAILKASFLKKQKQLQ
jgi:hypothetical protein